MKRRMAPKVNKQMPKFTMEQYDENHFYKLCKNHQEKCEFCDDTFQNRYHCLIHTAKHIIIPLIKNEIFQCHHCLFSFTSKEALTSHKRVKHEVNYLNDMIENVVLNNVEIKCVKMDLSPLIDYRNEKQEDLIGNFEEPSQMNIEKATKCNNENTKKLIKLELNKDSEKLPHKQTEMQELSNNTLEGEKKLEELTHLETLLDQPQQHMTNLQEIIQSGISITPIKRIKQVLPTPPKVQINHQMIVNNYSNKDEEFILPDLDLIHDSNKKCLLQIPPTPINTNETPVRNNQPLLKTYSRKPNTYISINTYVSKPNTYVSKPDTYVSKPDTYVSKPDTYVSNEPSTNKITITNGVIQGLMENNNSSFSESVHYDELIKPGMFRCKRCGLTFPNKFDVITHETDAHFGYKRNRLGAQHCVGCDYYIAGNYKTLAKHMDTKHKNAIISRDCTICVKCLLKYTNKARHDHIYHQKPLNITTLIVPKVKKIKSINESWLCDVCSMFIKNNRFCKYTTKGVLQEYGKQFCCSNCNSMVDAVEVLKLFKYSYDPKQKSEEQKDSKLSNEVRLKNIQRRLMQMKK